MVRRLTKPKPIFEALREDAVGRQIPVEDVLSAVAASSGEAARRMALDTLKVAYVTDGMLGDDSLPTLSKTTELLSAVAATHDAWAINMGVSALSSMTEDDGDPSVENRPLAFARRVDDAHQRFRDLNAAGALGGDELFRRVLKRLRTRE